MNTSPRWLTRAGALLVMVAFLLPTVSCTVMSTAGSSFSLLDLARGSLLFQPQSFLYLVPLGALATLIVSFYSGRAHGARGGLILGEAAGLAIGVLCILGLMASLPSGLSQLGVSFGPDFGAFVLLVGFALGAVGLIQEYRHDLGVAGVGAHSPEMARPSRRQPIAQAEEPQLPATAGPRLDLVKGEGPRHTSIQGEDFLIGRSQRNDLVIADRLASGAHARLRHAQGAWFIQDQNSSNGTFVNGRRIAATRLKDGDQILIGQTTFVFRK